MNRPLLAKGAEPILAARMRGKKPIDMVLVSLGPKIEAINPVVYADVVQRFDWRWVRGLDVCLYATDKDEWVNVVRDILLCRPGHMELWNRESKWGTHVYLIPAANDIGRPRNAWVFDIDFLPWMDFQNQDFIERRHYARDHNGMPYSN